MTVYRRFTDLVDSTPSLRAAQRDGWDHLVRVAAEATAARAGVSPDDPEPQIAAHAILGLWRVQFDSMHRYADGRHTPDEVFAKVSADVRRAARLIDSGLWAFGFMVQGGGNRDQLMAAADAAQHAGKQVAAAIRQARGIWRQLQTDSDPAAEREQRARARQARREAHAAVHHAARAAAENATRSAKQNAATAAQNRRRAPGQRG
jgi:hypothetical protein